MKYFLLFICIVFVHTRLLSQESNVNIVEKAVAKFVTNSHLVHASISINIIDLDNNTTIASYSPHLAIPPASTVKLFTTATAFEYLGAFYKPTTNIYYTGTIDSTKTLHGNIIIEGFGDVSLGSKYFNHEGEERSFLQEWIIAIKKLNIQAINGFVLADASSFGYEGAPAGWTWGDMGNYYGAAPSGLTIFDNLTYLHFQTGKNKGDSTRLTSISPHIPGLVIHNFVKSAPVKGDNAYVYGAPFSKDWFVQGELPLSQTDFRVKSSIPDPEELFAHEFHKALTEAGISISSPVETMRQNLHLKQQLKENKTLILKHKGKDVQNIAHWVNQKSVNLFAEHLLCWIGLKRYFYGNTQSGIAALLEYWSTKLNLEGIRITDGSGLSRNNAVSANHYTQLLAYMHNQPDKEFEKTLPISGRTGTLSNLCRGQVAEGRILAKSGTMSRIKSYAGYINTKTGKKLAFAIIVNNHTNSSGNLVIEMERLFNEVVLY
jgi:serine-type D-Ala-D-Ala carboxypeptidase/endopeptidase (penicillin-binding protein 4)